jgi:hypothetical protein
MRWEIELAGVSDGSDPADLPPAAGCALNPSGNTSLAEATKFYTGQNPIQTGVAAGTFDAQRMCAAREGPAA